ncbi:Flp pilus assembly protein protease CpaA [Bacillus ectoiniformans]|nr:Flp pilus assembly protein protease CpaA [Bacillus ectoiniformans]
MKQMKIWLYILLVVAAFIFNLLGLINLYPLYFTAPLLFLVLFIPVFLLNQRRYF